MKRLLTPEELLDLLSQLVASPRLHKHRFCGRKLARIYECLPLKCQMCGEPMRIIAFVPDAPTIVCILDCIGEPTQPPGIGVG